MKTAKNRKNRNSISTAHHAATAYFPNKNRWDTAATPHKTAIQICHPDLFFCPVSCSSRISAWIFRSCRIASCPVCSSNFSMSPVRSCSSTRSFSILLSFSSKSAFFSLRISLPRCSKFFCASKRLISASPVFSRLERYSRRMPASSSPVTAPVCPMHQVFSYALLPSSPSNIERSPNSTESCSPSASFFSSAVFSLW